MTTKDLEVMAADFGAKVHYESYGSGSNYAIATAPAGNKWVSGRCVELVFIVDDNLKEMDGAEWVECMRQGLVRFRSRGASR